MRCLFWFHRSTLIDEFRNTVSIVAPVLTGDQMRKLHEIAEKSPVLKTLTGSIRIEITSLVQDQPTEQRPNHRAATTTKFRNDLLAECQLTLTSVN